MNDYLIYIGDGSALHDVPARNLTQEEAEKFGIDFLLASKLYKLAETHTAAVKRTTKVVADNKESE